MSNGQAIGLNVDDFARLFEWQMTSDFDRLVTRLDVESSLRLLVDSKFKSLREALILRDFAVTLGFLECRLCPEKEQFPDGELRSSTEVLKIEITEVMTPGRKRHAEYANSFDVDAECAVSHEEWDQVKEAGSKWTEWMLEGIKKKLRYDKNIRFDIVAYNNISHLFEMPEITKLSQDVGRELSDLGYEKCWVWQCRATTIDLLWPRLLRLKIPGSENRF